MSRAPFSVSTTAWIDRVAKINNVKPEDVLRYLKNLSAGQKVIYHLKLTEK